MTTTEERNQEIEAVRTSITTLANVDPQSLARASDLSPDINFRDAVPHFEAILDFFKELNQRDISRLPLSELRAISNACQTVASHIKQVKDFALNQNNPGDVCNGIIDQIRDAYDAVMKPLILPLAFTATQATDYARIEREAKGYHATMKAESEQLTTFISTARTEAENALAAVKEQAAEAGVSTNAQIFVKVAGEHRDKARKWRTATIVMACTTLAVAVTGVWMAVSYQPSSTSATVQYVVAKLVVLSTLSFGLFWCARNFKSEKHNEVLNQHRANALMTFRAFVEGSSDDRVKDAILLQASQAAFSSRASGFDTTEKDHQTINPIVEVIGKTIPKAVG